MGPQIPQHSKEAEHLVKGMAAGRGRSLARQEGCGWGPGKARRILADAAGQRHLGRETVQAVARQSWPVQGVPGRAGALEREGVCRGVFLAAEQRFSTVVQLWEDFQFVSQRSRGASLGRQGVLPSPYLSYGSLLGSPTFPC